MTKYVSVWSQYRHTQYNQKVWRLLGRFRYTEIKIQHHCGYNNLIICEGRWEIARFMACSDFHRFVYEIIDDQGQRWIA